VTQATFTAEEIGRRGQALYEQELRSQVEAEHKGKFLILDIDSGDYEIDADDLTASKRLLARKPSALLYGVRIGSTTAYRLGGGFKRGTP
jgi:hypothetical protein